MFNFYYKVLSELFNGASPEVIAELPWFAISMTIGTLFAIGVLFFKLFKGR